MARNVVVVTLDGKDNLSGVIDGIGGKLKGLGGGMFGGLLDMGFNAAKGAVDGFVESLNKAKDSQSDLVKTIGSLASTINQPYEQAEALTAKITEGLAGYAAALPGETDQYVKLFRAISDDVASANMEMNNGALDTAKYEKQVTTLASKFQALGDGLSFNQVLNPLQKILSGGSLAQLKNLKYFQSNPILLKRLEEALGGKELKDLTGQERVDVAIKALDMTLTDDTIKRLSSTVDSQVQSLMTTLFDPTTGVFGLLRDLDKQAEGQQTAFAAINELVTDVIGSDGLLYSFAELLKSFGVDFGDPMQALHDGVKFMSARVKDLTGFFKRLKDLQYFNPELGQKLISDIPGKFAAFLSSGVRGLGDWIGGLDLAGLANRAIPAIQSAIASINWSDVGGSFGYLVGQGVAALDRFLKNLDWTQALITVGRIGIALTEFVAGWVGGFAGSLGAEGVSSTDNIGQQIIDGLGAIVSNEIVSIQEGIRNFFGDFKIAWYEIRNFLIAAAAPYSQLLASDIRAIFDGVASAFKTAQALIGGMIEGVINPIKALFDAISGAFNQARSMVPSFGGAASVGAGIGAAAAAAIKPKYGGHIPNAAGGLNVGGLIAAAIREGANMPSGAGLAVANTSEAILNRGQQAALGNSLANRGGAGLQVGTMNIYSQATDAAGIADDVMRAIADKWAQFQQSKLSPNFT
jgi:hypothetical protein